MIDDNIKLEKYNMDNIVSNIHCEKKCDITTNNEKNSLDQYKKLYNVYEKLFD